MSKKLMEKWKQMSLPLKASFWFLICGFLQKGISVLTTPVFTRLLSTAEYGQYNVYYSWMGILTIFTTLQLYYGVYMRGLVKYRNDRDAFSSSLQGLMTLIWGCALLVYLGFRAFWNGLFQLPTLLMLSMFVQIWTTASFHFWSARQRVEYQYKLLVGVTLFVSAAKPLLGVASIFLFPACKVEARILSITLVELLAYTGFYFVQMIKGKKFYSAYYWSYALKFNLPLVPHYLSQIVLSQCDRIMIERMVNAGSAGIYSLAYGISQIMTIFNTAVLNSLSPWLYQSIQDRKLKKLGQVSYSVLLLIAGVNLLLILMAPEVIAIFAPAEYYEAVYVIPPVAMSVFFIFMYTLFADFEFYFEKTKFITAASVMGATLNIGLNYLLIPRYGYIAAAYTTLVCYLIYSLGHYLFMRRICVREFPGEKIYDISVLLLISLAFLLLGFAVILLYGYALIRYGILIGFLIAVAVFRGRIVSLLKMIRKK